MAVATGESGRAAPSGLPGRRQARFLVLTRHDPDGEQPVNCGGISRDDLLQAQWAACQGQLLLDTDARAAIGQVPRLPVLVVDRPDISFLLDEEMLLRLERGDEEAVIFHRREHARYREELVLDEQGDVSGVRRTYASAVHQQQRVPELARAGADDDIVAVLLSADAAQRVQPAIEDPKQASSVLSELGIPFRAVEAAVRDLGADTPAQLKGRLLNLLQNRPETLALAATRAELDPMPFGWAHRSARIHPTARFVGDVIVGQEVCIGAGAVIIGPLVLEDGQLVAENAVRRAADEPDAGELLILRDEPERALDDSRPRQHVRDESWWFRVGSPSLRRSMDYLGALLMLALLVPMIPAVWLANRYYGDRGPLFYTHLRQTRGGKPFACLKFRSMVVNADELKKQLQAENELDGPQFKIARDPRITPVGHFLRKTNLDELPQALNIFAGHMSLVGPRPSPHDENQLCPAWRHARLSVRPGITGLWQVYRSKVRGADDFQEWIYYDMDYVRRRSFKLDVKILLLTVLVCLGLWTPPDAREEDAPTD